MKGKDKLKKTISKEKVTSIKKNGMQVNFKLVVLSGLIISLLLIIFSYHVFGSFFEMNDDARYVMAMKGFASPEPYNNFVSVYVFTSNIYIYLYKHFPEIAWYGYSMYFILWGALFNIYLTIYLFSHKRIGLLAFLGIFLIIYFFMFLQNVYWINLTRPALLGTSTFILLLSAVYFENELTHKNIWVLIFPAITYFLAHVTRLDAGYLGFICGVTVSIILLFKNKTIRPFIFKYISPVFAFIMVIYFVNTLSQKNNVRNKDFLEKTELIRQLIDYRNASAYIPKDKKDTIAYNAMINARYCSDDKVITTDFIKSLTNSSPLIERANQKKFDDEFGVFIESTKYENISMRYLNISFAFVVLIWLFYSRKRNTLGFIKFLIIQLFFIAIIVGMSYFMKLPARIYNPLLVLLTVSNILFFFSTVRVEKKGQSFIYFIPLLSLLFAAPVFAKSNKLILNSFKKFGRFNHSIIDDMNATFSNTIFIPTNVRSWELHNGTDPIHEINFKKNNCYVYLSIELSLAPETKDQLIAKFKTSDHSQLFKNISKMNNVVFLADESYTKFLQEYYYYIYNQNFYFEKISETPPSFYKSTGLNYYRVKMTQ